jgi:hypothetical protein
MPVNAAKYEIDHGTDGKKQRSIETLLHCRSLATVSCHLFLLNITPSFANSRVYL